MLNQDWFKEELIALGHTVRSVGADGHFDIKLPIPLLKFSEVVSLCGFTPDCVLIYDNSIPLFITHLDEASVPILYYAVDVQHHIQRQQFYPLCFDHIFVAQKDYLPQFVTGAAPVTWLPLWAPRYVEPSDEKIFDVLFVGTMNPALNPERVRFFDALKSLTPLTVTMGNYWELFPKAKIVINQTVKGDLNFRIFEALMCGSILLTEQTGNGLSELFEDGRALVTYERGNVHDAAQKIKALLDDTYKAASIAHYGRSLVLAHHTETARAATVNAQIQKTQKTLHNYFALAGTYTDFAKYLVNEQRTGATQATDEALRLIEKAMHLQHMLSYEVAADTLETLRFAASIGSSTACNALLAKLVAAYPAFFASS